MNVVFKWNIIYVLCYLCENGLQEAVCVFGVNILNNALYAISNQALRDEKPCKNKRDDDTYCL